jgi:sRNA-binding regulator protein Hfq
MMNRKLVRPNLAEIKEKMAAPRGVSAPAPDRDRGRERGDRGPRHRPAPPESTHAEAFYYLKQMNAETPMVLVLDDGERVRGRIEWYDRGCLKVHRDDGPNILLFKHCIRYVFKQEDE